MVARAILKCCNPQGIPTMVQQRIKPKIRCVSAISHQPNKIQSTLNTTCRQLPLSAFGTKSRPKGQSDNTPILNSCTPKGIPITVMHISNPANQYIKAVSRPPKNSQTRFPRKFMVIFFICFAAQRYYFLENYTTIMIIFILFNLMIEIWERLFTLAKHLT